MSELAARGGAPLIDHHQHIVSAALCATIASTEPVRHFPPITATDLVGHLDDAGIERAVVLSTAYVYRQPSRRISDARERVRRENEWTGDEVGRYPDRLIGFGSVDPLADWASDEIREISRDSRLGRGLKLHLANSRFKYHDREHIDRVRQVLATANELGFAIVVHMRAATEAGGPYGRAEARIFLDDLVPAAPDVTIQIAHLCGSGAYAHDPPVDEALSVFIEAIEAGDGRADRLWFDVTAMAHDDATPDQAAHLARRLRQLGLERVLYGSDAASPDNPPKRGWERFRALPLTDAEFALIARNVAPYLR